MRESKQSNGPSRHPRDLTSEKEISDVLRKMYTNLKNVCFRLELFISECSMLSLISEFFSIESIELAYMWCVYIVSEFISLETIEPRIVYVCQSL